MQMVVYVRGYYGDYLLYIACMCVCQIRAVLPVLLQLLLRLLFLRERLGVAISG